MSLEDYRALARIMRGRVPEWGEDYLERFIPRTILARMLAENEWVDEDGFFWGFRFVYAARLPTTCEPVVVIAQKPLGHGVHILKVVDTNGKILTYGPTEESL